MTHYFLDSSALIKRYIREQGTSWVRSITALSAGNTIYIAQVTPVEVVSGLSRRKREGFLSEEHARRIRALLTQHVRRDYMQISLSERVMVSAMDLLEASPLRAYDAIQLASALDSNDGLVAARLPLLVFVSADKRLLDAAASEGLSIEDPNTRT